MKWTIVAIAFSLLYISNANGKLDRKSSGSKDVELFTGENSNGEESESGFDDMSAPYPTDPEVNNPPSGHGWIYVLDAFNNIQGYDYNSSRIVQRRVECQPPVKLATTFLDGAQAGYFNVNFHLGARSIFLRYSNGSPTSQIPFNIKVYIDKPYGNPIADFNTYNTGGWCKFVENNISLRRVVTGIHHVYFVAKCQTSPYVGVLKLQYFRFHSNYDAAMLSCQGQDQY
ncbi:hypothetical protein CHUAL_012202 [Chamberlinius hualienensis]